MVTLQQVGSWYLQLDMSNDRITSPSTTDNSQTDAPRTEESGTLQEAELERSVENSPGAGTNEAADPASKNRKERRGRKKGSKQGKNTITRKMISKVLNLSANGTPVRETAKITGMTRTTINELNQVFKPILDKVRVGPAYRANKGDILDAAQIVALQSLTDTDKHAEASLNAAAYAFDVLYKAGRLERGQSTANTSVHYYDRTGKPSGPTEPNSDD